MELAKEILIRLLEKEGASVAIYGLDIDAVTLIECECYKALQKIKAAIKDGRLSDFECVEKIVCILEEIGSGGGSRHDF